MLIYPPVFMIRELTAGITIEIYDRLSGINPDSITLTVNSQEYRLDEFTYTTIDDNRGEINWTPTDFGIRFVQGDTIHLAVRAGDNPDYCETNISSESFLFMIEPQIQCNVHPNPFTPNNDGFNDFAVFSYPFMFSESAELIIFDRWNVEVYRSRIQPLTDFTDYSSRIWKGKDKSNKDFTNGIYIYIIKIDDEVKCNGTIIIAR